MLFSLWYSCVSGKNCHVLVDPRQTRCTESVHWSLSSLQEVEVFLDVSISNKAYSQYGFTEIVYG